MDRLTFLQKAREMACEQIEASSCMSEKEWAEYQFEIQEEAMNEEQALAKKTKEILEDAAFDFDD